MESVNKAESLLFLLFLAIPGSVLKNVLYFFFQIMYTRRNLFLDIKVREFRVSCVICVFRATRPVNSLGSREMDRGVFFILPSHSYLVPIPFSNFKLFSLLCSVLQARN